MLNNAMKFTPSGNIRISTNTNDPGHEVTDNIKDTEIGLAPRFATFYSRHLLPISSKILDCDYLSQRS